MYQKRYISKVIQEDALKDKKMAFLSGPRQVGKTTVAKAILTTPYNYHTWDDPTFKLKWSKSPVAALSDRGDGPVVLDEIHKDKRWKTRLKGLYDIMGDECPIVVTGSARLDIYRKGGDSMMGRYIPYRLHPFTVAESDLPVSPDHILQTNVARYKWDDLLVTGGFPEPFFKGSQSWVQRWSRLRRERLVQEDVRDLRAIHDLSGMDTFIQLFPRQVGSLLSINSLREDVGVAYGTAWAWTKVLESLYFHFTIKPYSKKISRAIRSEPKAYLFDITPISDKGARKENLIALHLYKACQFWTDTAQGNFALSFIRTKEKEEIDFCITREQKPWMLVECKSNNETPTKSLYAATKQLEPRYAIQVVEKSGVDRQDKASGVRVMSIEAFLAGLI